MAAVIQIKRRTGSAGAPTTLAVGELAYTDPGGGVNDQLFIGTLPAAVNTLISATRQVEINGAQTILGQKTIAVGLLRLTGGAANDVLVTDGLGGLSWTAAPSGGILNVSVDATLTGNGNTTPLSVQRIATARDITIQATGGTTITVTPATFDGSANALITGFEITVLDGGTY